MEEEIEVLYVEGVPTHDGPESCVVVCERGGEHDLASILTNNPDGGATNPPPARRADETRSGDPADVDETVDQLRLRLGGPPCHRAGFDGEISVSLGGQCSGRWGAVVVGAGW